MVASETKLLEFVIRMKDYGVTNIPLGRNDKFVGIISIKDSMRFLAEKTDWNTPVEKVVCTPELAIDSIRWLTDALEISETNNALISLLWKMRSGLVLPGRLYTSYT